MSETKYKRILLKLSGEALAGDKKTGIDANVLGRICDEIKKVKELGVEIAIVVGGGNFWRGKYGTEMERTTSDYMGMLATVMNAITLQSAFKNIGVPCRVQSAINMNQITEPYIRFKAQRHLEKNRVVIFAAGTGNPFFTTDTASALRASEVNAQVMLMAKNGVDGVYTDDPNVNKDAKKLENINYDEIIKNDLKVMDRSACDLCQQNNIPIIVFDFKAKDAIKKIILGEKVGTYVGKQ